MNVIAFPQIKAVEPPACCNLCGKTISPIEDSTAIQKRIGYGSKYDGLNLDMRLCCDCMDKLIELCKTKPI